MACLVSHVAWLSCRFGGRRSDALDDGGDAHAAADAERGEAALQVAALELVDRACRGSSRRWRPSGWPIAMAPPLTLTFSGSRSRSRMKRIATAAKASLISKRSMSSGVRPALASALRAAGRRAGEHDRRVGAGDGGRDDAGARREAEVLADLLAADRDERGAVDDAGGVAGVVDVVDLLDPVVLLERHRVEAEVAVEGERRLEPGQALHGGAGADELVLLEHGEAVQVLHRDHASCRSSRWPGPWRRGLRLGGVRVDVLAATSPRWSR